MTYRMRPNEEARARREIAARETFTVIDGVMRWKSSNQVPPEEWFTLAAAILPDVDAARCREARDADLDAFVAEYREAQARRTPEQVAEARAVALGAVGPGVTLENLFTGERWIT